MADIWYQCIKNIPAGWLKAPIGPDPHPYITGNGSTHPNCTIENHEPKEPETRASKPKNQCLGLSSWKKVGRISQGRTEASKDTWAFNGPAIYYPKWTARSNVCPGFGHDGSNVLFADLRGKGKADYIWIDPKTSHVSAWLNDGADPKFTWNKAGQILNGHCAIDHLRFADLSGSGMPDYICIQKDGSVHAWYNGWTKSGGFKWDGVNSATGHKIAGPLPGGNQNSIFFLDVNG